MQIHEITSKRVDEGLGSFFGKVAGGLSRGANFAAQKISPVRDFKSAYASSKIPQQTAMLGKKVADIWAAYDKQLRAATPDPVEYADLYPRTLTAFVQKNLLGGQSLAYATNKQQLNQLINDITNNRDNPQKVAQGMAKLVQQAAVSQQDVAQTQSVTKVISLQPAVLQFRNINYAIDNNGQWANQSNGRVPDESFQAFLDQELIKAGGSAPTPSNPPASTVPSGRRVSRVRGRP